MHRLALLFLFALGACRTPLTEVDTFFGAEAQIYPTGLVIGPRGEVRVGERDALHARAAVHFVRDRQADELDSSDGTGYGGGLGWRHWIDSYGEGWNFGARLDLWRLLMDQDAPGRRDESRITVLTPSIEGGYSWYYDNGARLDLNLGLGQELEVGVNRVGDPLGDRFAILLGVTFSAGTVGPKRAFPAPITTRGFPEADEPALDEIEPEVIEEIVEPGVGVSALEPPTLPEVPMTVEQPAGVASEPSVGTVN